MSWIDKGGTADKSQYFSSVRDWDDEELWTSASIGFVPDFYIIFTGSDDTERMALLKLRRYRNENYDYDLSYHEVSLAVIDCSNGAILASHVEEEEQNFEPILNSDETIYYHAHCKYEDDSSHPGFYWDGSNIKVVLFYGSIVSDDASPTSSTAEFYGGNFYYDDSRPWGVTPIDTTGDWTPDDYYLYKIVEHTYTENGGYSGEDVTNGPEMVLTQNGYYDGYYGCSHGSVSLAYHAEHFRFFAQTTEGDMLNTQWSYESSSDCVVNSVYDGSKLYFLFTGGFNVWGDDPFVPEIPGAPVYGSWHDYGFCAHGDGWLYTWHGLEGVIYQSIRSAGAMIISYDGGYSEVNVIPYEQTKEWRELPSDERYGEMENQIPNSLMACGNYIVGCCKELTYRTRGDGLFAFNNDLTFEWRNDFDADNDWQVRAVTSINNTRVYLARFHNPGSAHIIEEFNVTNGSLLQTIDMNDSRMSEWLNPAGYGYVYYNYSLAGRIISGNYVIFAFMYSGGYRAMCLDMDDSDSAYNWFTNTSSNGYGYNRVLTNSNQVCCHGLIYGLEGELQYTLNRNIFACSTYLFGINGESVRAYKGIEVVWFMVTAAWASGLDGDQMMGNATGVEMYGVQTFCPIIFEDPVALSSEIEVWFSPTLDLTTKNQITLINTTADNEEVPIEVIWPEEGEEPWASNGTGRVYIRPKDRANFTPGCDFILRCPYDMLSTPTFVNDELRQLNLFPPAPSDIQFSTEPGVKRVEEGTRAGVNFWYGGSLHWNPIEGRDYKRVEEF